MDEIHRSVLSINHFYFCLTVALKLHRQNTNTNNSLVLNCFIIKWARKAQYSKIFPKNVEPEIDWVLRVMTKQGVAIDAEPFFDNVYLKTKLIMEGLEWSG